MQGDPDHETLGVVAVGKEQLELVGEDGDELGHLERGEVLLPPDELLVLRAHCRYHVVEVHHDVDECVEQREEGTVTTCKESPRFIKLPRRTKQVLVPVSNMQCCKRKNCFFKVPGANFMPIQTENGIHPWWITWRVDTWLFFFLRMKNRVSRNSVNLEK